MTGRRRLDIEKEKSEVKHGPRSIVPVSRGWIKIQERETIKGTGLSAGSAAGYG
jgi:hypothetical protein